ncbi:MAG: response regulator [Gemmatimonadota bacterium]|nr:MAG: response regulator [Gemmatimonadota bacterium]
MASILIIDDEPSVLSMLKGMLRPVGHQVDVAGDGHDGVEMFKTRRHDLVITDIFMPGKEGIATIEDLRRESTTVKIIAVSGGGSPSSLDLSSRMDYLEIAQRRGADRILRKPFEWEEFVEVVDDVLGEIPAS